MQLHALPSLAAIPAERWDAMCPTDNPFLEHAWLHGLEKTGCVGPGTGWQPLTLVVTGDWPRTAADDELPDGVPLYAAAPLYAKGDSYGEFIFDFAWAHFFQTHGKRYYPKLVVAVPFTPATGQRLLMRPGLDDDERAEALRMLGGGARQLASQVGASSVHWLFVEEHEAEALRAMGYRPRLSQQARWENAGYPDFEAFLSTMRASKRKGVRRERRKARAHGLTLSVQRGSEMDDEAWQAIDQLYRTGCLLHGSAPYLTGAFMVHVRETMADRVLCSLAHDGERYVAGTFNLQKGQHLYGRYWGCLGDYDCLHFELGFYMLIERCIAEGWTRFEAGAGGEHKVRRGLRPARIHSAHWIADPQMAVALYHHLLAEEEHVEAWIADLDHRSTQRRGPVVAALTGSDAATP